MQGSMDPNSLPHEWKATNRLQPRLSLIRTGPVPHSTSIHNTNTRISTSTSTDQKLNCITLLDCQEGHYKQLLQYPPAVKEEGEIPETCNPAEPELEPFRCVASCEENEKGGYAFNEELQRCFGMMRRGGVCVWGGG